MKEFDHKNFGPKFALIGPANLCWNKFWDWTKTDDFKKAMTDLVQQPDFLEHNYLSGELRIPVTLLQTNACSPLRRTPSPVTSGTRFSSQSYKDFPSVGQINVLTTTPRPPRQFIRENLKPSIGASLPMQR
jgi:hypothetical protein